jgi:3-oxoadipate enol-lactonase
MPWFENAEIALRYRFDGNGARTIVLVHEAAGCLESFDEVAAALEHDFRVLRYDQRGFGFSEPVTALSSDQMVTDLACLLDALDIVAPVHLAGGAFGGDIASLFAARFPHRVASLTISSPRTGGYGEHEVAAYRTGADRVSAAGLREGVEARLKGSYPEHLRAANPARFAQYRARWLCNSPPAVAALMRLLPTLDLTETYPLVQCPAMVIGVSHDVVRPPEMAEQVAAAIRHATYRLVNSGHHFPLQSPELFASIVRDFVAEVEPETRKA